MEAEAARKTSTDVKHEWVQFFSVIFVLLTNMGLMFSFGSLFPHILDEFQESRANTATIQSVFMGVGSCTALFSGIIVQRSGPRKSGIFGGSMFSAGLLLSAFATSIVYMQLFYGIISGLGYGFLFISACQVLGQCFCGQAKLVATAVGMTAVGVGAIAYPFLVDWLVSRYGLKGTLLILGGTMLNSVPLAFMWGNSGLTGKKQSSVACGICSTVLSCLKYLPFSFVFFGIGLSLTAAIIFEMLALDILEFSGLSRDHAITAYAVMQTIGVPARLVPGFINMIPGCSSIMSPIVGSFLGGVGFLLLNYITDFIGCIAIFLVTGISRGIIVSCPAVVALKMLGTSRYATGLGLILCLAGVCTTVTGPLNGLLRDVSGSYSLTLYGLTGTMVLSMFLCSISMRHHRALKMQEQS